MKPIGTSKNGLKVVYDPIHSHAATHLEDTPGLAELVAEAISHIDLTGQSVATTIDMQRIVGTEDVIETKPEDEIVYGARKNRIDEGLVPFVKQREGKPSSSIAIQLHPVDDGTYELLSAWVGKFDLENDEPFPQSANATDQSAEFWNEHAFVYGSQEIIAGTETDVRPW